MRAACFISFPILDITQLRLPYLQARTSTIVPLKISSAFLISGSFLKSSLEKTGVDAPGAPFFAGPFADARGTDSLEFCRGGAVGRTRFGGASAWTNRTETS